VGKNAIRRAFEKIRIQMIADKRKCRMLFSRQRRRPPGPQGPKKELIDAVVELKRRNLNWGCPRIAQQITLAFGVAISFSSPQANGCPCAQPTRSSGCSWSCRRVKTQAALPNEGAVLRVFFGLWVSGQMKLRRIRGYRDIRGTEEEAA
jgi:hypothetical protein